MRRTHSIDLSPDQAPKPSYIKQVITRQAGFIRRLSYPHWYFFSIRRRSASDRRWCPSYASASIVDPLTTSTPKGLAEPRPVTMSLSYNMYNIGMRDDWSKVLKTLLFSTEIRFRQSISVRNPIQRCHFLAKTEGHGDTTSNLFHQKKKASCH